MKLINLFNEQNITIIDLILSFIQVDEPIIGINRDLFDCEYVSPKMSSGMFKFSMLS